MLLEWWASCSKIHGAKAASQFPENGFAPQNQVYRKDWSEWGTTKASWSERLKKSCGLTFPWYFVPILLRFGIRFLNPWKKNQNESVCFQRQNQKWWIEGGKGYGTVVTFSSFILVVKATHFWCRRLFLCLGKKKNPPCTEQSGYLFIWETKTASRVESVLLGRKSSVWLG